MRIPQPPVMFDHVGPCPSCGESTQANWSPGTPFIDVDPDVLGSWVCRMCGFKYMWVMWNGEILGYTMRPGDKWEGWEHQPSKENTMTEPYTPQVGDTVRINRGPHSAEQYGNPLIVRAVHGDWWWAEQATGEHDTCPLFLDGACWEKVVVYPERWWNVFPEAVSLAFVSRHKADSYADTDGSLRFRTGVLHLFPDGHTKMERP